MSDEEKKQESKDDSKQVRKTVPKARRSYTWQIISAVLLVLLVFSFFKGTGDNNVEGVLSEEEAGQRIMNFINGNLMQPGMEATLNSIEEQAGVYKMDISADGQSITSYVTKDGKTFFPQAMELEEVEKQIEAQKVAAQQEQQVQEIEKTEKPEVELFVMSHCPYGTQIEKGIIPVMEQLGGKADIKIKFCDYAMHGEKELEEQLKQYCIQEEQNDKYLDYLACFLEAGNTERCLTDIGIDRTKLDACVERTDAEYNVMADFENNKNYRGQFPGFGIHKTQVAKYGVRGSPTLVINGITSNSGRDPASLQKAICDAFTDDAKPAECDTVLDSTPPSPGFGFSGTGSASDANCGT